MYCATYDSPLGPLSLSSDGEALTGLWLQTQPIPKAEYVERYDLPVFEEVRAWLEEYFRGACPEMRFPLAPVGSEFQQRVWAILRRIPYGETTTYGAIAREISPNMSAQAVGGAVGRNPISIIVPCHRVVGAKGQLTGYTGGLEYKKWLLRHEEETK